MAATIPRTPTPSVCTPDLSLDDTGVDVVSIGNYEVAVLARSDIASVAAWLGDHGYAHNEAALDPLKPYVAMGWSVVAVRVVVEGSAMGPLAPIGFSWEGRTMRVRPQRLPAHARPATPRLTPTCSRTARAGPSTPGRGAGWTGSP